MKIQTKMRRLLTVVILSGLCSLAQAQGPGDPGGDPGGSVPIDGGLSLLIAAGIGYAAKKKYDAKKANEQEQQNQLEK